MYVDACYLFDIDRLWYDVFLPSVAVHVDPAEVELIGVGIEVGYGVVSFLPGVLDAECYHVVVFVE